MGRPINKRYFGEPTVDGDEIKVKFHNGTAVVAGWIVKQMGSKKFLCTDGTDQAICFLVDPALSTVPGTLDEGQMSIAVKDDAGTVEFATKITGRKVTTASGVSQAWNFDDATDDAAVEMEEAGDDDLGTNADDFNPAP